MKCNLIEVKLITFYYIVVLRVERYTSKYYANLFHGIRTVDSFKSLHSFWTHRRLRLVLKRQTHFRSFVRSSFQSFLENRSWDISETWYEVIGQEWAQTDEAVFSRKISFDGKFTKTDQKRSFFGNTLVRHRIMSQFKISGHFEPLSERHETHSMIDRQGKVGRCYPLEPCYKPLESVKN